MQEQEIIRYLKLLGEELAFEVEEPVKLLLVGGAYMVTQVRNRPSTLDIDVVHPLDPSSFAYRALRNVAHFVASRMRLDPGWLSDNIGEFISETQNIPYDRLWLKHGMVEVYLPDIHAMLMLKMITNREKDRDDIRALMQALHIKKRKQAESLLQQYGERGLLEEYAGEIEETLHAFFG